MATLIEILEMALEEGIKMVIVNCEIVTKFGQAVRDYGAFAVVSDYEFDTFDDNEVINIVLA